MGASEKHDAAYHGTGYLSEDEVLRLRLQGIPVTGVPPQGKCCARCRRGTPAHGTEIPCGLSGRCGCHDQKGNR